MDFHISTGISLLLLPAVGPSLPACHHLPSILLQTQQWIICFLSLRHCQCATCRAGSNSSCYSSWLVGSPSLFAIANIYRSQLHSFSFIFHSIFWRRAHLLHSCLCWVWRWSAEKKLGLVYVSKSVGVPQTAGYQQESRQGKRSRKTWKFWSK